MTSYLIVGGTKGIGRTFAKKVHCEENEITIIARKTPNERFFRKKGVRVIHTDLMEPSSIEACLSLLNKGRSCINYLLFFQRFRDSDDKDGWTGEIQVSVAATKAIIEGVSGIMKAGEDNAIVVVASSTSAYIASEQKVEYHVSKAALTQIVRYYAVTLGPYNIRVNAISSGAVIKEESAGFYTKGSYPHDLYRSIIPLRRMGHADDVANLAGFLCSPRSSFLTGQNIFLDGGLSLVWQESLARDLVPSPK